MERLKIFKNFNQSTANKLVNKKQKYYLQDCFGSQLAQLYWFHPNKRRLVCTKYMILANFFKYKKLSVSVCFVWISIWTESMNFIYLNSIWGLDTNSKNASFDESLSFWTDLHWVHISFDEFFFISNSRLRLEFNPPHFLLAWKIRFMWTYVK